MSLPVIIVANIIIPQRECKHFSIHFQCVYFAHVNVLPI